ncbi:acyl-CoA thioesterase [Streptacidiphilus pinicola]|uniref:Acyl-CoA thioesterase n=1 Tax=Streptacidiphilus pinicola TaxID=2219663 RepID=A0A2X0K4F8_9ACTN|nr:thioesterase family protein [Streptacidiphilus pinicola]RAG82419.1 acyl-CoA thioesterase [Streptacidiphilus pinicola]
MARRTYTCPLRWSDMDAFGHVNNVNFLRYLEQARIDFTLSGAGKTTQRTFPEVSVVARHEVDYLRPLVYRAEPVTVETWLTDLGEKSFTVAYEIKDTPGVAGAGNTVYARAATVMVPYDLSEARPRRLTAEERAVLTDYLEDQPVAV